MQISSRAHGDVGKRAAQVAMIVVAGIAMAVWTWGTWLDPIVDFGHEMYAPWQLSQGKVLYRDVASLNGPLSPYFNALCFRLFGLGIRTLIIVNIALMAALIVMLVKTFAAISNRTAAIGAALTFIGLFGFAQYGAIANYNFVAPYSHELTHGIILSVAAVACFTNFVRSQRLIWLAGTGVATGLVLLTKAEVSLAATAAVFAGFAAAAGVGIIPRGRRALGLSVLFGGIAIPVTIGFALFRTVFSARDAALATFGAWRYIRSDIASLIFYRELSGFTNPTAAILSMIGVLAAYFVVLGTAAWLAFVMARKSSERTFVDIGALAIALIVFSFSTRIVPWDRAARPLPLFVLFGATFIAIRLARSRDSPAQKGIDVIRLVLATFALVMLWKMALRPVFFHYGFALAMPATLVVVVALFDWIPSAIERRGGNAGIFRGVAMAGLIILVVAHLLLVARFVQQKQVTISSGRDAFRVEAAAGLVDEVLREIDVRLKPSETLTAFPEGVMLNYLSRRTTPLPNLNFAPQEIAAYGEAEILRAMAAHPPDWVLLTHTYADPSTPRFGRDYGTLLTNWIAKNYRPVREFGAAPLSSDGFGIALLMRQSSR